jgi:hypothetical protein
MKMTVRQCIMVQWMYRLMFRTPSTHYSHGTIAQGKLFGSTYGTVQLLGRFSRANPHNTNTARGRQYEANHACTPALPQPSQEVLLRRIIAEHNGSKHSEHSL